MRLGNEEIGELVGGERHKLPLFFMAGAVFLLGIGGAIWQRENAKGEEAQNIIFEAGEREDAKAETQNMFVDVGGAVRSPGVYELSSGARVKDALVSAGGLAEDADREYVSKSMNLAMVVVDGAKVYVPGVGERGRGRDAGIDLENGNVMGEYNVAKLININSAGRGELESLKGIGEVRAGEIIAERPYQRVEELVEKGVLGEGTFEKIKDQIAVY